MKYLFAELKEMTENNDHSGALCRIAKAINNPEFIKRFELIEKLHKLDGYMRTDLKNYAYVSRELMFDYIEKNQGIDFLNKIKKCI